MSIVAPLTALLRSLPALKAGSKCSFTHLVNCAFSPAFALPGNTAAHLKAPLLVINEMMLKSHYSLQLSARGK
jgi:hypothetical protein